MKFLAPLALLAIAAGVSAQDPTSVDAPDPTQESDCEAAYIVETCLGTENDKVLSCDGQDYECLCAAYQALRTCYNNCPDDPRISSAESQVTIFCQNASIYATTKTSAFSAPTVASTRATVSPTDSGDAPETTAGDVENSPDEGGAAELARNTGAVLLAVAGVMAAVL